ncbi:MAG: glucans biosynthesis glucosyltransferase MdoH [Paracraurococcus sp.]
MSLRLTNAPGAMMRRRRMLFAGLASAIAAALLALAIAVLAEGGWSVWEALILLCFALNLPWIGLAAATGLVGLCIRIRGIQAPPETDAPITLRTAIAICIRNEAMEDVLPPLLRLMQGLAEHGDRFVLAILSDTADPDHVAAEEAALRSASAGLPGSRIRYRRRLRNAGYKAGNVMDFLDHHAADLDLIILLDADSEMTPEAALRLVRVMQAEPRLGILQHPIAGSATSASFGRLFNLGHRAGARIWTLGQDWWQGDEGPFWGHNAILRIAPFRRHCRLPLLPDGSSILSHDHVEAARMHGAGWAVRVHPDTHADGGGSLEAPPPHLLAFLERDRRWAAGNLQYRHFLRDRSLGALGRLQMFQAILHYLLAPFWFAILPLAAINALLTDASPPRGMLVALLVLVYVALHLPRLTGHLAMLVEAGRGRRLAHVRSVLAENLFSLLFDSVVASHNTIIVLSHALRMPHRGWPPQQRRERRLNWSEAANILWPHTAIGLAIFLALGLSGSVFAVLAAVPAGAGLLLAIPFCVLTSDPRARV